MSGLPEFDTGVGWSFGLEIDGIEIKEIQEIDGLKLEVDSIELKHNTPDGKYINKMLPGRKKAGEITLTRGVTSDTGWHTWINTVFEGNMITARKGGQINIYDYMGNPVQSFKFVNGWAKVVEYGQLKAGDTSILTEKITIAHEGLETGVMRRGAATAPAGPGQDLESAEAASPLEAEGPAAGVAAPWHEEPYELRTEFDFVLPRGFVDGSGTVHRTGTMRLATARDELLPLHDDRVRANPPYLTVVLLARVITRLGNLEGDAVNANVVEHLFASDLAFLQDLYRRVNSEGHTLAAVTCPACHEQFSVDLAGGRLGGIVTYATDRLYEEVAYVAYHFHWSFDEILDLEDGTRRRFVEEIAHINRRLSGER